MANATKRKIGKATLLKRLTAGDTIRVRAKNGHCWPTFSSKPAAYNCTVGGRRVDGAVILSLCKRRVIECANRGWYTEGHFRLPNATAS